MIKRPLSVTGRAGLLALFLLLLFAGPLRADAAGRGGSVDLQALLTLGLAENLGLRAVLVDTLQAGEEVIARDALFDPEFFAEAFRAQSRAPLSDPLFGALLRIRQSRAETGVRKSFTSGLRSSLALASERIAGDDELLAPRYSSSLLLELRQPLLRGFGTAVNSTDLEIARYRQQQSRYLYLQQAQDLALRIEIVYYDLIGARQTELLRQEARELVVDLLAGNRAKLAAGVIPVSEVQEAETALAARDLQLALARQTREQLAHQLNELLNNRLDEPLELAAQLNPGALETPAAVPDLSGAYATALEQRFDLKSRSLDLKGSELRSAFLENRTRPELDMVVSAGLNGFSGSERAGSEIAAGGSYFDSYRGLADRDGYQWSAGFTFSYPLGNREAEARARQARLDERQVGYRKQELELAIETELRQRLTELGRTAEQFAIAERLQALAAVTLDQENRRLAEGLSDTFRVLSFQGTVIDAGIDRLAALVAYNKSLARFHQAQGTNLDRHGITARIEHKELRFEIL